MIIDNNNNNNHNIEETLCKNILIHLNFLTSVFSYYS